jgi:hypothetical protein
MIVGLTILAVLTFIAISEVRKTHGMVENSSKPWASEEDDQLRDILTLARLGIRPRGLSSWD